MDKLEVINKLEAELKELGPLYLGYDNKLHTDTVVTDIDQFIKEFFFKLNPNYCTYEDIDCSRLQCGSTRSRSLGDIYRILLSFIPEVSLLDLILKLTDTIETSKEFKYFNSNQPHLLQTYKCNDISKRVYFIINTYYNNRRYSFSKPYYFSGQDFNTKDEIGFTITDYLDLHKEYVTEDTTA